jgi:hypothetical protein
MHHSSLVAGAAVAAAGEMTVKNGALLSVSNWSGHYAPRPSCLRVLLDKLEEMGVSGLGHVQVHACGDCLLIATDCLLIATYCH